MTVLKDLRGYLRDDFDCELKSNKEYAQAEEKLHQFIESELSHEKLDEMESLIIDANNAMFHAAIEFGMKYGAKLIVGLLK